MQWKVAMHFGESEAKHATNGCDGSGAIPITHVPHLSVTFEIVIQTTTVHAEAMLPGVHHQK